MGVQLLGVTSYVIWGDELSVHGGSAPFPVFLLFWLTQLPGYYATTMWLFAPFPERLPEWVLYSSVCVLNVAFWTIVVFVVASAGAALAARLRPAFRPRVQRRE
jgi:hypothetical protein